METIQKLVINSHNTISIRASVKLGELLGYLDQFEPSNDQLYYVSLAFTRVVGWGVVIDQWVWCGDYYNHLCGYLCKVSTFLFIYSVVGV